MPIHRTTAPPRPHPTPGKPRAPINRSTKVDLFSGSQPTTAQDAAPSRTARRASVPDSVPPITSARDAGPPDLDSGPDPNALALRLDAIAQGLAALPELRAEVRALSKQVEQLAAAMTDQGRVGADAETPSSPGREASPTRAGRPRRLSGLAGISASQTPTDASEVEPVLSHQEPLPGHGNVEPHAAGAAEAVVDALADP